MTIKEFGECLEFNINHNIKHAILGLGAPGVGKSQLIRQIGEKYGYKVIDIRLAQMSEVEIGGLIYPNESRTKTVWLSPEILPDEERDGKNTILLLDEITSCSKRVQVAAYQLILDRRIGQYHLPEGTFVVALGNTEDDDGVYIQLAGPLADRFEIHYIQPDFDSWKNDFALKNDVHQYVIDYLTFKPSALHNQVPGSDYMIFATPRSWVRVSDILKFDDDIDNKVIRNKIIGNVGSEGMQFIEFCKKQGGVVTVDDFMKGKTKAPTEPSELSMLVFGLAHKVNFISSINSVQELTEEKRKIIELVIDSLFRIPQSEYIIVGLKSMLEKNRSIIKTIFLEMDDVKILKFINENKRALGWDGNDGINEKNGLWYNIFHKN
jgi:hypothetical protein